MGPDPGPLGPKPMAIMAAMLLGGPWPGPPMGGLEKEDMGGMELEGLSNMGCPPGPPGPILVGQDTSGGISSPRSVLGGCNIQCQQCNRLL